MNAVKFATLKLKKRIRRKTYPEFPDTFPVCCSKNRDVHRVSYEIKILTGIKKEVDIFYPFELCDGICHFNAIVIVNRNRRCYKGMKLAGLKRLGGGIKPISANILRNVTQGLGLERIIWQDLTTKK
jgi:hypothetical protein